MEDCLYYALSITFCLALSFLFSSLRPSTRKPIMPSLPPGPTILSPLGPLLLLAWTSFNIEPIIRAAQYWYGPVFTLYLLPSSPVIFITDRAVARRVLVQSGASFADRPPTNLATAIFNGNQRTITTGGYGPLWRVLRRNLTGRALHPSSLRRYAAARADAVSGLTAGIARQSRSEGVVVVQELLHHAIFHVFTRMCFGEGLGDGVVASVTSLQREFLSSVVGFQVLGACPPVTRLLFRRRWKQMLSLRRRQEELFIPLIRARRALRGAGGENLAAADCYVDTLLDLRIPEDGGGRNLTEGEMVNLCSEFLSGGPDSTATAMQWTMANLVARPEVQAKLRAEINGVVASSKGGRVDDMHLPEMPYLRAVVLEGLRRHPPGRFMLPHAAAEEGGATLDGFSVPRHTLLNFTLGGMAMDGAVWRDPERFRPERFLPGGEGEDVDLTGVKEIKMMPFGAGRRICPGIEVSLLHLEYFVANLVGAFEWREVPGEPVDFGERLELTMVMRRPLRAIVVPCH
ncbi:hypothetical protein SETIT_3G356000v2 [Setaria italica]|uniref:Cytochrome P450 n=1 Tax=Setaria italica TaxID=4555 RepID=K3Z5G2_SETIT|nr:cytochrome P450 89A2 [Setaria italica]RCV19086.1 hypothetical protein SETIT_3G356000v2 [Setaria italica]